jgi:hypothetical protein
MTDDASTLSERARGLHAAERVATGMLHEIRNVLNPILSAAWLLQASAGDQNRVRELAARIEGFAKAEGRVAAKMRQLLAAEGAALNPADAGADQSTETSSSTRTLP